jgi:hypothetical protein
MTSILILCREDNLTWVNAGYARALRRAGVRLHCVPWGTPFNANLHELIEQCPEKPDYIFHPETDFPLLPWGLAEVDIPTVIFHTDPYAYTHRRVRWSRLFDHVVLLHFGFEDCFKQAGNPRPMTLVHAVDVEYFEGPPIERVFEVSSVGRTEGENYTTRREMLTELSATFRTNEWWRLHPYEEMAMTYRASKIVLNIPRDDFPVDVSLRFAEAMAAGALFIARLPSELPSLGFEENVHFVAFRERSEVPGLLRCYLKDEKARGRIAEAGREKVLREHTYNRRAKTLLELLERDGCRLHAPARRWSEERVHLAYLDFFSAQRCLEHAWLEWRKIAGGGLREAAAGAALLLRAWTRWPRRQVNVDAPHSS